MCIVVVDTPALIARVPQRPKTRERHRARAHARVKFGVPIFLRLGQGVGAARIFTREEVDARMFNVRSRRRPGFAAAVLALIAAVAFGWISTAASSTATDRAAIPVSSPASAPALSAGDLRIAATTDASLTSPGPADRAAASVFAQAAGVPISGGAPQAWEVGGRRVLGYTAADGRFCYAFRDLTGGCLAAGSVSDAQPLDITTDYGPGTFHVYGIALDGVTAVTVRIGAVERPAAFAHNAFFFSDAALGGTAGISGELVATMSDGSARAQRFGVSPLAAN
jgi:hypothetical protein